MHYYYQMQKYAFLHLFVLSDYKRKKFIFANKKTKDIQ